MLKEEKCLAEKTISENESLLQRISIEQGINYFYFGCYNLNFCDNACFFLKRMRSLVMTLKYSVKKFTIFF